MNKRNKLNVLLTLLVAAAITLACSSSNQTAEANKIVDEANEKLEEARNMFEKVEKRNTVLFSARVRTRQELDNYKVQKSSEAKSIVGDYEKLAGMLKDISKQYDDVSRMNLNEKYKDYARLKADEFTKRAEAIDVRKGNAQAFAEIDNPDTMLAKFDENNSKSDRLFKDAEDIASQARRMENENKEVFRQS